MIEGLSHVTLVVRDLDAMTELLEVVLGAELVYSSGARTFSVAPERFFVIGGVWVAVMHGDVERPATYDHVAFTVPDDEIDAYAARARSFGVEVTEGRSRIPGEGRSVYFRDFDNHLFELHSGTLAQRLETYRDG